MPALPSVPNTLRARVFGAIDTIPWNNVFHLAYTGGAPSVADAVNIAGWMYGIYLGSTGAHPWPTLATADTHLDGVTVTDLSSAMGSEGTYFATASGTRTGDSLPAQACVLGQYTVPLRYRGGHPRQYFPLGAAGDQATRQEWETGFLGDAQSWFLDFCGDAATGFTAGTTAVTGLYAVSYYSGHVLRTTPLRLPLSPSGCALRICTIRRRLGKVGG